MHSIPSVEGPSDLGLSVRVEPTSGLEEGKIPSVPEELPVPDLSHPK